MDLLERRLKKHSDKLKMRAEEAFKFKAPSGDLFASKDIDREVQKWKLKVCGSSLFSGMLPMTMFDGIAHRYKPAWLPCQVPGNLQRSSVRARKSLSSSAYRLYSLPRSCSIWPLSA